jgi:DNA-binding transcriptional regulator YiaG
VLELRDEGDSVNRPPAELVTLVKTGEAVRLRKSAGISQATMGAGLGVTQETVCQYELGQRHPTPARAAAWLRILRGLAWHEQAPALGGDDP